jgi:glycosyltransferase involved in cell wall biosynthesis
VVRRARSVAGALGLLSWGVLYRAGDRVSGGGVDWLVGWRWRWLGWAEFVAEHAPDADVWHGHDLTSLPAVVALKRRRGGIAVYDSHEIYLESGTSASRPRWAKSRLEALERELVSEVDAVVTVNQSLASILGERLRVPDVIPLYNCPPRYTGPTRRSRLREAFSLPSDAPLALYHGSLTAHRGIEQLLVAIREPALEGVHLAFLGYGALRDWLGDEVEDPKYEGRVHVHDGVKPLELLSWMHGVDVAVVPIQPSTMNHIYSSPNKVFEAIAVGIPVAGSDFPEFKKVVLGADGPLGILFDPTSPQAIAAAIRAILDLAPGERDALRLRCWQAAQNRWNWEIQSGKFLELYDRLEDVTVASRSRNPAVGFA